MVSINENNKITSIFSTSGGKGVSYRTRTDTFRTSGAWILVCSVFYTPFAPTVLNIDKIELFPKLIPLAE